MILIEEAEKILNRITCRPETEEVPLMDSLGRVLGQDIVSRISMPPFDKSAMDGYAVPAGNFSEYRVLETIGAGEVPTQTLAPGTAIKIMTGAPVPSGAEKVIMVEKTSEYRRRR